MKKATQAATIKQPNGEHEPAEKKRVVAQESELDTIELPVLPVRNMVLVPNIVVPLLVTRDESIKALEEAMSKDRTVFAVTQHDENQEERECRETCTEENEFTSPGKECCAATSA